MEVCEEKEQTKKKNPLEEMNITDSHFLEEMKREKCPKCNQTRKMFCYDCFLPMGDVSKIPKVKLPIELTILHWPSEARSKSTAVHACLLAADNTHFYDHPDIPSFNPEETVLLYPSEGAPTVADFPNLERIKNVIFVDSQWHSAKRITSADYVKGIPHIQITQYQTLFWRYQNCGPHCLATIEAIYYFYKEYETRMRGSYHGQYDDLLFYFAYHYNLIQKNYKEKAHMFPRMENYVEVEFQTPEQEEAEKKYFEEKKLKMTQNKNKLKYKNVPKDGENSENNNNNNDEINQANETKKHNKAKTKRIPKYISNDEEKKRSRK